MFGRVLNTPFAHANASNIDGKRDTSYSSAFTFNQFQSTKFFSFIFKKLIFKVEILAKLIRGLG